MLRARIFAWLPRGQFRVAALERLCLAVAAALLFYELCMRTKNMKCITAHTADRTSAPSLLRLSLPHPLHPFVSSAFFASASFCAADPPPAPATRGAGAAAAAPDAAGLHAAAVGRSACLRGEEGMRRASIALSS